MKKPLLLLVALLLISSSTAYALDFTSSQSGNIVYGKHFVNNTYRPPGVNYQWLKFDLWTGDYFTRGVGSHIAVGLYAQVPYPYKGPISGIGMILGDNHLSPQRCATATNLLPNTTQMELWTAPYPYLAGTPFNGYVSNTPTSCGDFGGLKNYITYSVEVRASDGGWVRYIIREKATGVVKADKVEQIGLNVPIVNGMPVPFNNQLKGYFIAATEGSTNWRIYISNLFTGWGYF